MLVDRSVFAVLVLAAIAGAQTPQLLRDIITDPPPEPSSHPQAAVVFRNAVWFRGETPSTGRELCRTDGTAAGTAVFVDTWPGFESGDAVDPTVAGGLLYFAARTEAVGMELFATDGTHAGTRLVADVAPGPASGAPRAFAALGSSLVFCADDGVRGAELWISDGTSAGTRLLHDVAPGGADSRPSHLTRLGARIVFQSDALQRAYATDGSSQGLVELPGPDGMRAFGEVGGRLVFADAGLIDVWSTDGTAAGTVRLSTLSCSGCANVYSEGYSAVLNGRLFYGTSDALFATDGTVAGTARVAQLTRPVYVLATLGDRVVFKTRNGCCDDDLWASDGTAAGTRRISTADVAEQRGGSIPGAWLFHVRERSGSDLWRTDGTALGTYRIDGVQPDGVDEPGAFVSFGSGAVFAGTDVSGREPWFTDGTGSGTRRIANLSRWPAGWTADSSPSDGVDWNGRAMFMAGQTDWQTGGPRPWRLDSLRTGPRPYGPFPPDAYFFEFSYHHGNLRLLTGGGRLTTIASFPFSGPQRLFVDYGAGPAEGDSVHFDVGHDPIRRTTEAGGMAWVESEGRVLRIDGARATPLENSYNAGVEAVGGCVAVTGTMPGTFEPTLSMCDATGCRTIWTGSRRARLARSIVDLTGRAMIGIWDRSGGPELLVTDGRPGGDHLIDMVAIAADVGATPLAATRDFALVSSGLGAGNGGALWRIAGTPPAATRIWTEPTAVGLGEGAVAVDARSIVVALRDAAHGYELRRIDALGVHLIADLTPGADDSEIDILKTVGDEVWFRFGTEHELWKTDGTAAGTVRVFAGTHHGRLFFFSAGNVFFDHDDVVHGLEPWVVSAGATAQPYGAACSEGFRAPWLDVSDPVLGRSWSLEGGGGPPGVPGFVRLGFPATSPKRLGRGCTDYVHPVLPDLVVGYLADSSQRWQVTFGLPSIPALVGAQMVLQSWSGPGSPDAEAELSRPVWLSLDSW